MSTYQINNGAFEATIESFGAALIKLSGDGFELIEPDTKPGLYAGTVLAPWPNRIKDGRYLFSGEEFHVPINETSKSNALHGLVAEVDWKVIDKSESKITFQTILDSSDIYPGKLKLTTTYEIKENKCQIEISAENIGSKPAPYGVSIHTYLVAGGGQKVDELQLQLPSHQYLEVDKERLLPIEVKSVEGTDFDFRKPKKIANTFIDHAFRYSPDFDRQVSLINNDGRAVIMKFDSETKWIQIHTADRTGGTDSRMALAVEPMTCPPDAFNSKEDLIVLAPGQSHRFTCSIEVGE